MKDFGFDPQRALELLKRSIADAPTQLADGITRVVRDTPPERIEQLMRSPARRPILDGIFWQMPKQINSERAAGVRTSIRWCITGRSDGVTDIYKLEIDDGRASAGRETGDATPRLTITVDGSEFVRIATGNSEPMEAYFKGRVLLAGDIMFAATLGSMFKIPGSGNGSGEDNPRP
jgi:putative sterol carrier protein